MTLDKLLENPVVYKLNQLINPWTVRLCAELATTNISGAPGHSILDIGSGIGARRYLFPQANYIGIDINPDYVDYANKAHGGGFHTMDAGALTFAEGSVDDAMAIAVCHHLDDQIFSSMVTEALRIVKPGGALHIIDAILPVSSVAPVKRFVFMSDRGRHQRTVSQMAALIASLGRISNLDVRRSPLHDVCYFRIVKN
jgi:SAM-dependent methyltransferase